MHKPTLLQIEDCKEYALIFKARFKSSFDIILCESIAEVKKMPLEKMQTIDLIVCDGNLPDGLGFEALSYLKEIKISAKMVGNSSEESLNNQMSIFTSFSFQKSQLMPQFDYIHSQMIFLAKQT